MDEYVQKISGCFTNEVVVSIMKPPSYILNIQVYRPTHAEKVIFIYKEANSNETIIKNESDLDNISVLEDSLADLSVTGQPLECPFEKNEDLELDNTISVKQVDLPEEYYYEPVPLSEARKCLTFINLMAQPPLLPVWILTDAADQKHIFLVGVDHTSIDSSQYINKKWITTMWAMTHHNQTKKVPINQILEDFEKTFNISNGSKRKSAITCLFDIKNEPGIANNTNCFLEVNWEQPSYQVPIAQADSFLIIECKVGQEESQVYRWWQHLLLMHKYLEIIKQRKQSCKLQMTYQRDSIALPSFKSGKNEGVPLASRVQELLKVSDSTSVYREEVAQKDMSAFNATIQHLLKDNLQKGQDVTDKLWSLLIEADTYQELAENFQLIIREVQKSSFKPYIFAKNQTRLACLLRNIKSSSDIELLLEPLELMVEMGLEKLKRDYIFIFMSSQLASAESLSLPKIPSFSEVGGSKWQATVEAHMQWLAQVHTVLELVSVIHSGFNCKTLVQVAAHALGVYVRPSDSPVPSLTHLINNNTYTLRSQVLTKDVANFVKGDRMFYKWILEQTAETEFAHFSSTFTLLEQSPLPQKIINQLQQQDLDNTEILMESINKSDDTDSETKTQEESYTFIQLYAKSLLLPCKDKKNCLLTLV